MTDRIKKLTELTMANKLAPETVVPEFDRADWFLPQMHRESKRICEFILAQEPVITEYNEFTGLICFFTKEVVGDAFSRNGHYKLKNIEHLFYLKSIDNISTYESQHAAADYERVLKVGIKGIINEIHKSLEIHKSEEEQEFLHALERIAGAIIGWANKCSLRVAEFANTVTDIEHKNNLILLSVALKNVPENGATSFYEALVCIYLCFSFDPDSFGTLDRYLKRFYESDIERGIITRDKAKEYLQEFLLLPQIWNSTNTHRTRGGQSHFCIGGYDEEHNDSFCDITKLIIESLVELPTYIPQITFRWTAKTTHDVMKFVMDCERSDKNKRIAFTNDEKRIKCLTEICCIPYEKAIKYTMVGCNELCFPGAISASTSKGNVLRCIETLFHKKSDLICNAETFEEFFEIFKSELYSDLDIIYDYDNKYNYLRSKDISYVSCLFFNGCIESAKTLTRGGASTAVAAPMLIGITNLIDSLIVVKQFVYDEKLISMRDLCEALCKNWQGYEDIRNIIIKKCHFFGNNDDLSNSIAQRFYDTLYNYLYGKRNLFGYPIIGGDHTGYNEHFKWFGEKTGATPDGRFSGDPLSIGNGQSNGRDRDGLTALLSSVASVDEHGISAGSTVTNIMFEETLVRNDESFDKLVSLFEAYFASGGIHFQLNYVSKDDLLLAKQGDERYKGLRVRVTGFSDYFVNLKESVQDNIIERTVKK